MKYPEEILRERIDAIKMENKLLEADLKEARNEINILKEILTSIFQGFIK
jgi:hypothetical protein